MYYYGARYYAAWLCRFVSVDPLQHKYPYYTPYQYAGNKPVTFIDLDGLEPAKVPLTKMTPRAPQLPLRRTGENLMLASELWQRGMNGASNVNWTIKTPQTLEDAVNIVSNYKPKTLVYNAHGSSNSIIVGGDEKFGMTRSTKGPHISESDLYNYFLVKEKGIENITFPEDFNINKFQNEVVPTIEQFKQMLNSIEDYGTVVMYNCEFGQSSKGMELLYQLSDNKLTFYAYTGLLQPEHISGDSGVKYINYEEVRVGPETTALSVLDTTTPYRNYFDEEEVEHKGIWNIIGPETGGKVKTVKELDLENNTGLILLNSSGTPNYL